MMSFKYNPGFSSDAELIDRFVVRRGELQQILQTLQENRGHTYQHLLLIGARGTGKTMLVRRVAAEVRLVPELSQFWYPLVFGEESYRILSAGEFWLEALEHLALQNPDAHWPSTCTELRQETDNLRLQQRALAQLMDFADRQGQQILLIVENLNLLFDEQMGEEEGWNLRHTLQNEPRLMLLGTATQRFDEIDNVDRAWFEFFALHTLEPLPLEDCHLLWQSVTGVAIAQQQTRPMQILTGGNPRLLQMLAEFAKGMSFQDLMGNLTQLIDSHTDYFKSLLERLPATERRVFVELLELWRPASTHEVAAGARLSVNKASALLKRLMDRGAIEVVAQPGKKNYYQVSERLLNIYYLMRKTGTANDRVRATIEILSVLYVDCSDILGQAQGIIQEAATLAPAQRIEHLQALFLLVDSLWDGKAERMARENSTSTDVKALLELMHSTFSQQEIEQCEFGFPMASPVEMGEAIVESREMTAENFEEEYDQLRQSQWDRFFSAQEGMISTVTQEQQWLQKAAEDLKIPIAWKYLAKFYRNLGLPKASEAYMECLEIESAFSYSSWMEVLNYCHQYEVPLCQIEKLFNLCLAAIYAKEVKKIPNTLQRKFMQAFIALVIKAAALGLTDRLLKSISQSKFVDELQPIASGLQLSAHYHTSLAPQELSEVGADIAELIHIFRREHQEKHFGEKKVKFFSLDQLREDHGFGVMSSQITTEEDYVNNFNLLEMVMEDVTGELKKTVMKSQPHVNARKILLYLLEEISFKKISLDLGINPSALYKFHHRSIFPLLTRLVLQKLDDRKMAEDEP